MAGRRKALRLEAFFEKKRVGVLERSQEGVLSFSYSPDWLESSDSFPLSCSLPLAESPYRGDLVYAFFDNLLPDSVNVRRALASRTGAGDVDCFSLLAVLGRDCAGALRFLPESNRERFSRQLVGQTLNESQIAEMLRNLSRAPLGVGDDRDFRLSIAGAQEKTALLRLRNKWIRPHATTPTSHIFKVPLGMLPNGVDLSTSVENEWLCLRLAEHFGLTVPSAMVAEFEEEKCLIVERFDRQWSKDKKQLKRVPVEDMCQALGIASARKYQSDGGPGIKEIMEFLNSSNSPSVDRKAFMRSQLVFYLLGAVDGHAKNFSIFIKPGGFNLAPIYDVLSAFPALSARQIGKKEVKLAMSVGDKKHYRLSEIQYRHFEQMAKAAGFSAKTLRELTEELISLAASADSVARGLPSNISASVVEKILAGVRYQAKVLGFRSN